MTQQPATAPDAAPVPAPASSWCPGEDLAGLLLLLQSLDLSALGLALQAALKCPRQGMAAAFSDAIACARPDLCSMQVRWVLCRLIGACVCVYM